MGWASFLDDFPELFVSFFHMDRVGGQAFGERKLELKILLIIFPFSPSSFYPSNSLAFFLSFHLFPSLPFFLLLFNIIFKIGVFYTSVQFSCSVVSDSLRPHESQHSRPPCPSPSPGVHPDSCPSSQ